MKVLIVAKTRQGSAACIGGITSEGRSVRLIAHDAGTNERAGMEYQVGEVWEVDAVPAPEVAPPHVENVIVRSGRRLGRRSDPAAIIEKHMPPRAGSWELLFEGLAQATPSGALYIAEQNGVPPYSTTFWRPDRPLVRVEDGKRLRYCYETADGGRTLVFTGFQEPVEIIPAGTLLRVSLAHWWRRGDDPAAELRCYVQLSGWFLPQEAYRPAQAAAGAAKGAPHAPTATPAAYPDPGQDRTHPPASAGSPLDVLKSVFGYDAFRPLQAEIIANLLAGRDSLAVMPTGSGKSVCYQVPALLLDGLTVVVSPLISLMQDQVMQLRAVSAPAAFLNSTVDYANYRATAAAVRAGEVRLLYTSPETLLRPETLVLLDRSRVRCLAIDEAHCISEWGHDFRPEYRQLIRVRQRYPEAACIALTATATERVRRDIQERLGLRDEDAFLAGFNRPNLFLAVQPRTDGPAQVQAFLAEHRDQSGIIYCSTRAGVEQLAAHLAARGWSALPYHAGMDDDTRRRNQELFSRDRVPIIVATIAFGMGIHKSNVRFVLHTNLPKDLESYYQEIGRAGRDGLTAHCLLLFNRRDLVTIGQFIDQGAESERAGRQARLQAMARYAESEECRRVQLLAYFGEQAGPCGFCDNCLAERSEASQVDVTAAARLFLETVYRTGEVFGATHITDILRGSRSQRLLGRRHDRLPTYAAGREHAAGQWRRLAEAFISRRLLEQDMEHGGLRLTEAGRAVLQGAEVAVPVHVLQEKTAAAAVAGAPEYDAELFERLRALRRELADAADVPPYIIFSDRTLAEMAAIYPQSPERLLEVHGVGRHKLAAYGDRFLEVIRAYCAERGLTERLRPGAAFDAPPAGAPRRRWQEVGEAYAAGETVEQLMARYGVTRSTIVAHLGSYAQSGAPLDPAALRSLSRLSGAQQEQVLAVMAELGPERLGAESLGPIFARLGGAVPYEELHVLRAYILCLGNERVRSARAPTQEGRSP